MYVQVTSVLDIHVVTAHEGLSDPTRLTDPGPNAARACLGGWMERQREGTNYDVAKENGLKAGNGDGG